MLLSNLAIASSRFEYLPKGLPGEIIHHDHYSLNYAEKHEQSSWVIYKLDKEKLKPVADRTNDFRADPYVSTYSATETDYFYSGFDRGHLVPAGSMKFSWNAMSQTFYMSNMSPQHPGLNRQLWLDIESKMRKMAAHGDLYIVTGPVLGKSLPKLSSGVSVPEYFYKVVYSPRFKKMYAFLTPNKYCGGKISDYQVSVDKIEKITNLDFFSSLPSYLEDDLESQTHKLR
ncbi:DNA/RNA non-specific endonuclease [bacterium]|nr:DNA/RNA non-specific endonuclease [bacterium]